MNGRPRGILLAAGTGSRFGADKLLHPLDNGLPMAVVSARNLVSAVPGSLAVVRPGAAVLTRRLEAEGLEVVVNERAGQGMGSSLAQGVAAAGDAHGWVVALADMPFIPVPVIARVALLLMEGAPLAAPAHRGRRGHPVGIGRRFHAQLLHLSGDAGARGILRAQSRLVTTFVVEDPAVLLDVDVPGDIPRNLERPSA